MSLDKLQPEIRAGAEAFIDKYQPELTVDNFYPQGIKFTDDLGQTIVVVNAKTQGDYIIFTKANADVFVILEDGLMIGWVHQSSLIDAEDQYMMPVGSLNKMPRHIKFAQDCPHISYFGGYKFDSKYVLCFGCGKEVV